MLNDSTTVNISQSLVGFARQLHGWGANVSAIRKGSKGPSHKWEHLQRERQTIEELNSYKWGGAAAVGVFNGPGGWRIFDIDAIKDANGQPVAAVPLAVLTSALVAAGLPDDYIWSYISGSGAGYGFVVRCNDELPEDWPAGKGVLRGIPLPGLAYDHLELRWSTGQTVIHGAHPTGPGYTWRKSEPPFVPPAELSITRVIAAFEAIAELSNEESAPAAGTVITTLAPNGSSTPTAATGNPTYVKGALKSAVNIISSAPAGDRNNTLLRQSRSIATLVNGGEIDEATAKRELLAAATAAGLTEKESKATIESGFRRAGTEARTAPPPEQPIRVGIFANPQQPPIATKGQDPGGDVGASLVSGDFHRSDVGNAGRLVAIHGKNIRYVADAKHWRVFNGKVWEPDTTGQVMRFAIDTTRRMYSEAAAIEDEGLRKEMVKHAVATEKRDRLQAMIALAQSNLQVVASVEDFDQYPYLLAVRNGVVDLKSGDLLPHDRGLMLSRMVDIEYNPEAKCPQWWGFLETIFDSDPQMIGYVQRAAGYSLTGDTSEQCFFDLWGGGGNGKSTFMRIMGEVAGDHYLRMSSEAVQAKDRGSVPNDVAQLPGKRLVVASELEAGRRMAESLVKDLTGGDDLSARFLFGEWFTFHPQCKLWIVGNHKLQIRGTDDGIWRRVRLIPFTVQIPEHKVDRHLTEKLREELPGILAWVVRGCLTWQKIGLSEPAAVIDATDEYRKEQDFLADYLADCCELEEDASEPAALLYQAYRQWCREGGEKEYTQRVFGTMLRERRFERTRTMHGIVWHGLRLSKEGREKADRWGGPLPLDAMMNKKPPAEVVL